MFVDLVLFRVLLNYCMLEGELELKGYQSDSWKHPLRD